MRSPRARAEAKKPALSSRRCLTALLLLLPRLYHCGNFSTALLPETIMLRSIHTALSSGSPQPAASAATAAESRWDQQVDTVESFRELFTKHDHMIPMRDGIKLYTTLFVPKLVSSAAAD